jgi:hypothetical protein
LVPRDTGQEREGIAHPQAAFEEGAHKLVQMAKDLGHQPDECRQEH